MAIRRKIAEQFARFTCASLLICTGLTFAVAAHAGNATFADLLAQAKAQAAAGHRWAPPGDNVTETVMKIMDIVPAPNREQLLELSALLDPTKSNDTLAAEPTPLSAGLTPEDLPRSRPSIEPPLERQASRPNPATTSPLEPTYERPVPTANILIHPVPNDRSAALFSRGNNAERLGDISGARRFYSSAAQLGDAAAARNLGRLYDPAYLKQIALGGVDPDPEMARHCYQRAIQLGDTQAAPLLEALSVR